MGSVKGKSLEGLLTEFRNFYPSTTFKENANINSKEAIENATKDPENSGKVMLLNFTGIKNGTKCLIGIPLIRNGSLMGS